MTFRCGEAGRRGAWVAAALVAAVVASACAPSAGGHSLLGDPTPVGGLATRATAGAPTTLTTPPTTAARTTSTVAPTTTTAATTRPPRPYAVGVISLNLTDASRKTGNTPGRYLPTFVFYPAAGAAGPADVQGAPGAFHDWPVVLFAEGYNTTPLTYHDLIHHLAAAGFVVVAPEFPLETSGGPLDENDLVNEPGDITYVFDQVLAANSRPGVLQGLLDPAHLAMVGHSDGGEAVLGAAYLPGQIGARVGVVVAGSAAGVLLGNHGGSGVHHEVLVIQGTADTINPPAYGDRLYATTPSPKAYLQLINAQHLPPFASPNQWHGVVLSAIVDWLDAWIPDLYSASASPRLGHDSDIPGTAQVRLG